MLSWLFCVQLLVDSYHHPQKHLLIDGFREGTNRVVHLKRGRVQDIAYMILHYNTQPHCREKRKFLMFWICTSAHLHPHPMKAEGIIAIFIVNNSILGERNMLILACFLSFLHSVWLSWPWVFIELFPVSFWYPCPPVSCLVLLPVVFLFCFLCCLFHPNTCAISTRSLRLQINDLQV